jgi:hypothetical protein
MSPPELSALAADIAANGQHDPIKWRSLPKIASIVKLADTAVRQALKNQGEDRVAQRKTGNEMEYWIAGKSEVDLRQRARRQGRGDRQPHEPGRRARRRDRSS